MLVMSLSLLYGRRQCVMGQECAWESSVEQTGVESGCCLACDPLVHVCGQDCMYTPATEPGSRRPQSADVWACPQPSGAITEVCLPRGSDYENYLKHASGVTLLCLFHH